MFRNPRENASHLQDNQLKPSVGRAPSPPRLSDSSTHSATMPVETVRPQPAVLGTPNKISTPAQKNTKSASKGNTSILNFFKKADNPQESGSLFVAEKELRQEGEVYARNDYSSPFSMNGVETLEHNGQDDHQALEEDRYNESPNSNKRRKVSHGSTDKSLTDAVGVIDASSDSKESLNSRNHERRPSAVAIKNPYQSAGDIPAKISKTGPFIEQSDSEDEASGAAGQIVGENLLQLVDPEIEASGMHNDANVPVAVDFNSGSIDKQPPIPSLKREGTSFVEQDGFADFENMEDFDDEYEEGEEFVERRYMQEQRRLEAEAGIIDDVDDDDFTRLGIEREEKTAKGEPTGLSNSDQKTDPETPSCPICNTPLTGITDQEASVHVNNCIDGNPTPLPTKEMTDSKAEPGPPGPARPLRPAKPGQQNPFILGQSNGGSSAFNKLMSGHSEENAWSIAAASERDSRGKPAYQRTCPFYKILPGLFICVDAFRYGAVSGCNAYFLSHFHSDHYVGLTSNWSHGKIYCSHITANLVRQQLRVDPKWVVDLQWDQKVEVPGTEGVHVTMIPANHCPGSSIYLFEKVLNPSKSAPSSAKPRTQRILHCGDFRACPAHIAHPLLAPEIVDDITGRLRHQKIDVCYLDTTYLSPKYAFPSQEEVIEACADMCVSLSKEKVDHHDSYESMKRERAGTVMTKFVRQDLKDEGDDIKQTKEVSEGPKKSRGQLLVVVGTYSIGKERICLGIARALDSLIYAPPSKQKICAALKDAELNKRLTSDPLAASVHMTPLFEIRAETLSEYLETYKGHFTRAVGFRPSGWNYRPPGSRSTEAPTVQQVLHSPGWKSNYTMKNLMPQRGSNNKASVFGVPYSEHSSFRELNMFVCGLRIEKVIPTVNVGSAKSRERMRAWCERWAAEKRKNGLFRVKQPDDKEQPSQGKDEYGEFYPGKGTWELRTTL